MSNPHEDVSGGTALLDAVNSGNTEETTSLLAQGLPISMAVLEQAETSDNPEISDAVFGTFLMNGPEDESIFGESPNMFHFAINNGLIKLAYLMAIDMGGLVGDDIEEVKRDAVALIEKLKSYESKDQQTVGELEEYIKGL